MSFYTTHRDKDFSLKSLELLIILTKLLVKYMLRDKEYTYLFTVIINKILNDLSNHENKKKDEKNDENEKRALAY